MLRKFIIALVVVAALGVGYWAGGRFGHAAKTAAADGPEPEDNGPTVTSSRNADPTKPIPVVAGAAERRDMPIYLTGIGTVSAFNTVQVKAWGDGQHAQIRSHAQVTLLIFGTRPLISRT
jgi:multidrug efflux system membrane fusion protein